MANIHSSKPRLIRCTFDANHADRGGGAIVSGSRSRPLLVGCTFTDNEVNGSAPGFLAPLAGTTMASLSAAVGDDGAGGAVFSTGGAALRALDCRFEGNRVVNGSGGGAVHVSWASLVLTECDLVSNETVGTGGGLCVLGGSAEITNGTFSSNSALDRGGGLFLDVDSIVEVRTSSFDSNGAGQGAGINNEGNLDLAGCTIASNASDSHGGGIFNDGRGSIHGRLRADDCFFRKNVAQASGAGLFTIYGTAELSDCRFDRNDASSAGGGIFGQGSQLTGINCLFTGNTALSEGGGGQQSWRRATPCQLRLQWQPSTAGRWGRAGLHDGWDGPELHLWRELRSARERALDLRQRSGRVELHRLGQRRERGAGRGTALAARRVQ